MTQKQDNTKQETTKPETALTEREAALVAESPQHRGFDDVSIEDITVPRAKLLQSNSPEVSDPDFEFRAGDIIDATLMEKLPEKFVPLRIYYTNSLFVPREAPKRKELKDALGLTDTDMEQMFICRADDGKTGDRYGSCAACGKHRFKGAERPICNNNINVLLASIEDDGELSTPRILTFSNTSHKHGKRFVTQAMLMSKGRYDLFDRVYKLSTERKSNDAGVWFEMQAKPAGFPTPEQRSAAADLYSVLATARIVADEPEMPPADTAAKPDDALDF